MGGALVVLFMIPRARQLLALQLPPGGVCGQVAAIVAAYIVGLTVWRHLTRRALPR